MNDTGAYFVGSLFGKHKMNERISPHKTWEGFFGGWIFGAVAGLAFGFGVTFAGYPMLPTLDATHWYWIGALALVLPLISDLGDLAFSMVAIAKNQAGLKAIYRLISDSHTTYLSAGSMPKISRQELIQYRENLIFGSACFNGEVFEIACNKSEDELRQCMFIGASRDHGKNILKPFPRLPQESRQCWRLLPIFYAGF